MNTIMNLLRAAGRAIGRFLGQVQEAASEGVMPEQNLYAVHANVEWGRQWLITAFETVLRGGRIQVTTLDLVMLAIFVASTILARRGSATPVMVLPWHPSTTS